MQQERTLETLDYSNRKADGLIHQLKNDVRNNSFDMRFEGKGAKEIFLNSLPSWLINITISTTYENEDFKLLLTKSYKGGVLSKTTFLTENTFGKLYNQEELEWLKYVLKLK